MAKLPNQVEQLQICPKWPSNAHKQAGLVFRLTFLATSV